MISYGFYLKPFDDAIANIYTNYKKLQDVREKCPCVKQNGKEYCSVEEKCSIARDTKLSYLPGVSRLKYRYCVDIDENCQNEPFQTLSDKFKKAGAVAGDSIGDNMFYALALFVRLGNYGIKPIRE